MVAGEQSQAKITVLRGPRLKCQLKAVWKLEGAGGDLVQRSAYPLSPLRPEGSTKLPEVTLLLRKPWSSENWPCLFSVCKLFSDTLNDTARKRA